MLLDHSGTKLEIHTRETACLETDQHTFEWTTGHWRNQGRNLKFSGIKWKWKHNLPELWDTTNTVLREKFIVMSTHMKNKSIFQITQMKHPRVLNNRNNPTPKAADDKK